MKKLPISLIIDDPAPRVFVYYEHASSRILPDGRPLVNEVPNQFLLDFCDVIEKWGMKGKFSVVPMPGGRGDIVKGIPGFPQNEIEEWLEIARTRVAPRFSICPEILTHAAAVDLATGNMLDINEKIWAQSQTRETLTPYLARALALHREAHLPATGFTSPWDFGITVEKDYIAAIADAFDQELGKKDSWYFLHCLGGQSNIRPWVAMNDGEKRVVSIPATTGDHFWQTMNTTDASPEYISRIADELLSADGASGEIIDTMNRGCWPILITHWQSLFSNGLGTGLKVLSEVGRRIEIHLSHRVEWLSFEEIMQLVLANPGAYPPPALS